MSVHLPPISLLFFANSCQVSPMDDSIYYSIYSCSCWVHDIDVTADAASLSAKEINMQFWSEAFSIFILNVMNMYIYDELHCSH